MRHPEGRRGQGQQHTLQAHRAVPLAPDAESAQAVPVLPAVGVTDTNGDAEQALRLGKSKKAATQPQNCHCYFQPLCPVLQEFSTSLSETSPSLSRSESHRESFLSPFCVGLILLSHGSLYWAHKAGFLAPSRVRSRLSPCSPQAPGRADLPMQL